MKKRSHCRGWETHHQCGNPRRARRFSTRRRSRTVPHPRENDSATPYGSPVKIVGDTAKLARIGANAIDATSDARRAVKAGAELIENADDAIDFAKYTDDIIETAKNADDIAEDIYSARKVDGTIKGHLDSVKDPIAEMKTLSKSIAKTSPIKIPENAEIKPKKTKAGYYHMEYDFSSDDGYQYITRWHTRNPTAPLEQRDVWIVERRIKGIGYGPNNRKEVHEVWVGGNEWITHEEWKEAATANQLGYATEQQKEWLKNGHRKA